MRHKIFCIIGESSSGKDTLTKRLCDELGLKQIISYTTRLRRNNEGETHIFTSDEIYHRMEASNQIAAYTKIGEYRYWSVVNQLYENDIYIIDAIGLKTLEDLGLEDLDICSIYINVPFEIRLERAIGRGDDLETFLARSRSELEQFTKLKAHAGFDYAISNLNEEKAFAVLKSIIETETTQN